MSLETYTIIEKRWNDATKTWESVEITRPYPTLGDSIGELVGDPSIEKTRDDNGFTNPNLHRRVMSKDEATKGSGEAEGREYMLTIQGVHSYRTIVKNVHSETSPVSPDNIPDKNKEIP